MSASQPFILLLLLDHHPQLSHNVHTWGISTRSPTATPMAMRLPSRSRPPGPTARTLASLSFSTLDSGRKMPLAVLVSALTRWTSTRSRRGARARMERIVDCGFRLASCLLNLFSLHSNCSHIRDNGTAFPAVAYHGYMSV